MKQKRLEREEKEKQEQLQREKQRRIHGKEMTSVKQKYVTLQTVSLEFLSFIRSARLISMSCAHTYVCMSDHKKFFRFK